MAAVTSGFGLGDGREVLVDLARAAASASGSYSNFVLTRVDDHVVRMSVMTEPSGRQRRRARVRIACPCA
jgi:hypothetical protein